MIDVYDTYYTNKKPKGKKLITGGALDSMVFVNDYQGGSGFTGPRVPKIVYPNPAAMFRPTIVVSDKAHGLNVDHAVLQNLKFKDKKKPPKARLTL
jgi:hypothetical protein